MKGKNIVITSGTSGIGSAIVKKIYKQANKIIINYYSDENKVKKLLAAIPEKHKDKLVFVKADMSTEEGLEHFIVEILKVTNKIDWLILNTGIGTYKKFDDYDIKLWNNIMNTNVTIPLFLVKKLKDYINENGKILFISSYASIMPYSSSVVYGTSKAAVSFLAKTLVKEFEYKQVSVNAVAPGFIETQWQKNRTAESRNRINKKIALHKFGMPEDVASLCCEILNNNYINGSIYEIHGGYNYF